MFGENDTDYWALFPAYAGVIPDTAHKHHPEGSFPRICRGDPATGTLDSWHYGFSPHTRG